jgi:hypothetical protein
MKLNQLLGFLYFFRNEIIIDNSIISIVKDLSPQTNVDTQETCKPLETIICNGVEYRLYDVCGPWIIRYRIAIEEDFL